MAKARWTPRALMERAVEVMRQSVNEPRDDGKACPIVGAVILMSDDTVEQACRGELRYGDHAEYTLLERKLHGSRLDGSVLFATLEPCAPGARDGTKTSCAKRIVDARIKEVWVGIEDPDPKVDRKGIEYLKQNGIVVRMFESDLQGAIREANKDFIAQALVRAEKGRRAKAVPLSSLENAISDFSLSEFSRAALEHFRAAAGIDDEVGSEPFNHRLQQQGALRREQGQFVPTGFGLLLFGNEPRVRMPQAGLLGTIHYPGGQEEARDFDGPMALVPEQVEQWLRDKLPSTVDRSKMRHEEVPALPFELVREAVVNALVHRDYDILGAKCQLVVSADTVTVMSPGLPVEPITLRQLQDFSAPMLSRNPQLQYVFAQMDLANERGWGMKTLKSVSTRYGLPLPKYSFEAPYLVLSLYRSRASAELAIAPEALAALSRAERSGWQWLATKESVGSGDYATALGIPNRTALNHLKHFAQLGLVERAGAGPATRYRVVRQ